MAASNSTPNQTLVATIIAAILFLLMTVMSKVQCVSHINFKFDRFVLNQQDLLFQGDASVSAAGVLQLTNDTEPEEGLAHSIGRALYAAPIQIWDRRTGKAASFSTSFSFLVKASNADDTSDGLTFFLAPANAQIPPNTEPGYLGLFNTSKYDASSQIVAVEFDTYYGLFNPWDPNYKHIGIDVNCIESNKTVKWNWKNGEVAKVEINYQAITNTLIVSQYYPVDGTKSPVLTYNVDITRILPEWISIGFSAAYTAIAFETHDILSWHFTTNDDDALSLTAADAINKNKEIINHVPTITSRYVA